MMSTMATIAKGNVAVLVMLERTSKNSKLPTGDVEVKAKTVKYLMQVRFPHLLLKTIPMEVMNFG